MSKTADRIISVMIMLVVLSMTLFFFNATRNKGIADQVIPLNDNWTISFRGESRHVGDVTEYALPQTVARGDSVVMERTLPDKIFPRSVLRFKMYHSVVKVYEDNELIYDYGEQLFAEDRPVGSGMHLAYLSKDAAGKRLKIFVRSSEKATFASFAPIDLLPASYANTDFFATHATTIFIGIFLVLFGVLSIIISSMVSFFKRGSFRFMMIGFLSLSLGTWTLCYSKLIQVFSFNFSFNTSLEYFSLYIAPVPLGCLLLHMRYHEIKPWKWWALLALVLYGFIFAVVTSILHFTNTLHFPQTLLAYHIYVAVAFIYLVFLGVVYTKKMDLSGKLLSLGILMFAVVAFADLIRYNIYKYHAFENARWDVTLIPIGTLIFILLLVLSYLIYLKNLTAAKAEKDVLAAMVYIDSLTGLYNRAKCEQVFQHLDAGETDYAIMSVDLDGLKKTNDTYGHSMGDKLISTFARVLKTAFQDVGTSIRMGGDEFIEIVRKEHLGDLNKAIEKMLELQKDSSEELPIPLSMSYGVAKHSECDDNAKAEDVYRKADAMMYGMKVSSGNARIG